MNFPQPLTDVNRMANMRQVFVASLVLGVLLVGCGSAKQKVVGTWKGEVAPPVSSSKSDDSIGKSLENGIRGMISSVVGPMTYEFNDQGRYKLSMNIGSQEGKYSISGNDIQLDSDDGKNHSTFVLSEDGKSMSSKKNFKSDESLVLHKQAE